MPDYVDDILLARYIGITVLELEEWPVYRIDQYRTVMYAESHARNKTKPDSSPGTEPD